MGGCAQIQTTRSPCKPAGMSMHADTEKDTEYEGLANVTLEGVES